MNREGNQSVHGYLEGALDKLEAVRETMNLGRNRTLVCDQIYGKLATLYAPEDSIDQVAG